MKGPSMKNKAFKKRSLTPEEKKTVAAWKVEMKARWSKMLERNQWKPTK
jgi:hypothetical protein